MCAAATLLRTSCCRYVMPRRMAARMEGQCLGGGCGRLTAALWNFMAASSAIWHTRQFQRSWTLRATAHCWDWHSTLGVLGEERDLVDVEAHGCRGVDAAVQQQGVALGPQVRPQLGCQHPARPLRRQSGQESALRSFSALVGSSQHH